jgi:hypothetical protein
MNLDYSGTFKFVGLPAYIIWVKEAFLVSMEDEKCIILSGHP